MIAKGLKVGDTFIDGKLLYKIIDISPQGYYVSSLVGKAGEGMETPKEEEVKDVNVEDMSFNDLRKLAKDKGVSTKGNKDELLERLRGV